MTDQEDAIRRALARSCLYSLLSVPFHYPEREGLSGLNWGDGRQAVAVLGSPNGLKEALESVADVLAHPSDLRSEYARIFGHTIQSDCPPYETQYGGQYRGLNSQLGGAQIFEQSQTLADIAAFYRAFGLEVSDQVKERLDHISIELEFMAFLAYKEAHALAADGKEHAEICREAQKTFLNDHLGRWVPLFTRHLRAKAQEGFYQKLALLTERFLALEVEALGLDPLKVKGLAPIPLEPEGGCLSCGITDPCFSREELSWGESGASPGG